MGSMIHGYADVRTGNELNAFFDEVKLDHAEACLEIAQDGARIAKEHIHNITGNLSSHVHAAPSKFGPEGGAVVYCDANHAHLVEWGHALIKGGKRTVHGNVGGEVIGVVPPHPFMRPSRNTISEHIEESVAMIVTQSKGIEG